MSASSLHLVPSAPGLQHDAVTATPAVSALFEAFGRREAALSGLQQTLRLVADIQQHRGSSMAILAGNQGFEARLQQLQEKIAHRLAFLNHWRGKNPLFNDDYWHAALLEWQAVSEGWRDDTVLNNFELHSHLVEKLLNLIRTGGHWLIDQDDALRPAALDGLDLPVVAFAFHTLPAQIEMIARLRGLATHAASSGLCDDDHRVRIEYLLQLVRREQAQLRTFTSQRSVRTLRLVPGLLDTQLNETLLLQWMERIATDVVHRERIRGGVADDLFATGTLIIDGHFAIALQSLNYLRMTLEDCLEARLSAVCG